MAKKTRKFAGMSFEVVGESVIFSLTNMEGVSVGKISIKINKLSFAKKKKTSILTQKPIEYYIYVYWDNLVYQFVFGDKTTRDSVYKDLNHVFLKYRRIESPDLIDCLCEDIDNATINKTGKDHHMVGVYNNDEYKVNYVSSEELAAAIQFDLRYRPGRALFVDGFCLNEGCLGKERCEEYEKQIRDGGLK